MTHTATYSCVPHLLQQVGEWARVDRQQHLLSTFHFDCACRACGGPGHKLSAFPEDCVRVALLCPVCPPPPAEATMPPHLHRLTREHRPSLTKQPSSTTLKKVAFLGACSPPPQLLPLCSMLPASRKGQRGGSGSDPQACSTCGARLSPAYVANCGRDLEGAADACERAASILEALDKEGAASSPRRKQALNNALQLLAQGLHVYTRFLHPGNHLLGHTFHIQGRALATALVTGGEHLPQQQAAEAFLRSAAVLAHSYPPRTPQLAFEMASAGACLLLAMSEEQAEHSDVGQALMNEAEGDLQLHFGQAGVMAARSYVSRLLRCK